MIRIGIVGDIGSGKSYIAKQFGYPVFNADAEVSKLYKNSKKCFLELKKNLPNYITSFPVKKTEISSAILSNPENIKKIIKIVHPKIRNRMNHFTKKNKTKKFVILDVPLLLENKLNKKKDFLIFISAKKNEINKRLKKRPNFKPKIVKIFKKNQLSLEEKKKKSNFVIKNNFNSQYIKKNVRMILKKFY
ncbi:dephospho-CoA kinase [Pelagibacteraceae bacterium]|nr:dephospho-CoA kinase [Pelagibacteraceae bacterium]